MVHSEIHYVPISDGWEEVLVHNVLHYVPVLLSLLFSSFLLSLLSGQPRKEAEGSSKWHKSTDEFRTHDLLFTTQAPKPTKPRRQPMSPEYLLTQHSCKETSPPLLHTTTHHNTQQHTTTALGYIKLPMYQLSLRCLYLMILRGATSLLGALEGVGPENLDFFEPKWQSLRSCHFRA